MNKSRRKEIAEVLAKLEDLKADVERLQSDEQDAFDALPESVQGGERGDKMQAAADALGEAVDAIDGAVMALEQAAE